MGTTQAIQIHPNSKDYIYIDKTLSIKYDFYRLSTESLTDTEISNFIKYKLQFENKLRNIVTNTIALHLPNDRKRINTISTTINEMKSQYDTWVFKPKSKIKNYDDYHTKSCNFQNKRRTSILTKGYKESNYMDFLNYFDSRTLKLMKECNNMETYYRSGYYTDRITKNIEYYNRVKFWSWCTRRKYERYYRTFKIVTLQPLQDKITQFKSNLKGLSNNLTNIQNSTNTYINDNNKDQNILKTYKYNVLTCIKQITHTQDYTISILENTE